MPRIVNAGDNVDEYCEREESSDSWFDVCLDCWDNNYQEPISTWEQSDGRAAKDLKLWSGDPLGTETNSGLSHPCYEYENGFDVWPDTGCDDHMYICACCGAALRERDN